MRIPDLHPLACRARIAERRHVRRGRPSRGNGFTALRLGLAAIVLLAHTEPIGGYGPDRGLGASAVVGFFGLSGYLLVESRERTERVAFFRNRIVRIFPALWLCVLVTVGILGPLAAMLGQGAFGLDHAVGYVLTQGALGLGEGGLGRLFAQNPIPYAVNGSLWTLAPEFLCYVVLVIVRPGPLRMIAPVMLLALVVLLAVSPTPVTQLWVAFALGATIRLGGLDPGRWAVAAGCALYALSGAGDGSAPVAHALAVPIVVIGLGLLNPLRWNRDLSYGLYLYAFPITQVLAGQRLGLGPVAFAVIVLGIGLAFAWLSWSLVEHPALRLFRAPVAAGPARHAPPVRSAGLSAG